MFVYIFRVPVYGFLFVSEISEIVSMVCVLLYLIATRWDPSFFMDGKATYGNSDYRLADLSGNLWDKFVYK